MTRRLRQTHSAGMHPEDEGSETAVTPEGRARHHSEWHMARRHLIRGLWLTDAALFVLFVVLAEWWIGASAGALATLLTSAAALNVAGVGDDWSAWSVENGVASNRQIMRIVFGSGACLMAAVTAGFIAIALGRG